jgi:hypothetical protein
MPLNKPWTPYHPENDRQIPGNLGVFEIGDSHGKVLYIGYAGGRTRFGLRESIPAAITANTGAVSYRYEINQMYTSRWIDLLSRYRNEHGSVPEGNLSSGEELPRLGRVGM